MEIKEDKIKRLELLIRENGGTQTAFAAKLGIKQQNISDMLRGNRAIGKNFINSLYIAFGVNPEWMETGEGDMFLDANGVENARTVTVSAAEHDALLRDLEVMREQIREITKDKNYFLERVQDLEAELKKTAAPQVCAASCAAAG